MGAASPPVVAGEGVDLESLPGVEREHVVVRHARRALRHIGDVRQGSPKSRRRERRSDRRRQEFAAVRPARAGFGRLVARKDALTVRAGGTGAAAGLPGRRLNRSVTIIAHR